MPSEFLIQKCFFNTRSIGCEILKLFLGRSNKMLLELSMTLGTLLGKYFFLRDSASNPEGVIRDSRVSVSDVFYTVSRDYLPCILEMEGVKEGKFVCLAFLNFIFKSHFSMFTVVQRPIL